MNYARQLLLLAACSIPLTALAQDLVIEEIVVTAQKRSQSVQDVPIAVNAIDADTIEALGIDEFTDLAQVSPSLTFSTGTQLTNSGVSLRGIGTNVFSTNIEPSVLVVVDDVALVRQEMAFSGLLDIERIEVLRGPQSTLFGKSSSAGVINIVTRNPGDEFSATLKIGVTDDDEVKFSATAGGPISDNAGVIVTAFTKEREGHIYNLTDESWLNGYESSGARGKLVWDITDRLSTTFIADYSESEVNCCSSTFRLVDPAAMFLGLIPQAAVLGGLDVGPENRQTRLDDPTMTNSQEWGTSLKFDYALGESTLTSITAYKNWDYDFTTDVDGTDFDILAAFTGGALSGGIVQGGPFELKSVSQEFRLTSPSSDRFEYIVGLYYADVSYDREFARLPLFAAAWAADSGTESIAAFGQATLGLGDNTKLIFGLRLNKEEISHDFRNALSGERFTGTADENAIPGRLGIQHWINDDIMLFGTYSRGYKGQGYDISSSFNAETSANPVGSEDSDAFELGMKGTFFGGRLQFNPTIFFAQYDDFQAQETRIVGGVIELGVANVGSLETSGIEIDSVFLVNENFRTVFGFAYVNATIKEFAGATCWGGQTVAEGCINGVQDLSGADLNNSPDIKFTLSGEYTLPFNSLPFDGFINASYTWQDELHFDLLNDPGTVHDSYGILNLSFGIYDSKSDRYQITLFVNNVLDENFAATIFNGAGLWGNTPTYTQIIPREATRYAGIRASLGF